MLGTEPLVSMSERRLGLTENSSLPCLFRDTVAGAFYLAHGEARRSRRPRKLDPASKVAILLSGTCIAALESASPSELSFRNRVLDGGTQLWSSEQ